MSCREQQFIIIVIASVYLFIDRSIDGASNNVDILIPMEENSDFLIDISF